MPGLSGGDFVTVSQNKRRTNDAWDAENMAYQTVKVRKELLQSFRAAVAANGQRVNTVLKNAMEDYIAAHAAPDQQQQTPKTD